MLGKVAHLESYGQLPLMPLPESPRQIGLYFTAVFDACRIPALLVFSLVLFQSLLVHSLSLRIGEGKLGGSKQATPSRRHEVGPHPMPGRYKHLLARIPDEPVVKR